MEDPLHRCHVLRLCTAMVLYGALRDETRSGECDDRGAPLRISDVIVTVRVQAVFNDSESVSTPSAIVSEQVPALV